MPLIRQQSGNGPDFFMSPTSGVAGNGLPIFNWDQAAAQLTRDGASWSFVDGLPVTVTYAFRNTGVSDPGLGVTGFQHFNATQIVVAEEMLRLWSEVANITFVRVGSGTTGRDAYSDDATILFGNFNNGAAAFSAFTYLPTAGNTASNLYDGDMWFNISRDYDADPATFPLGAHILAHEIGHSIGLDHPSNYDGGANSGLTYAHDAQWWEDSWMFSNMSYFPETSTGGSWGTYALAPQMFDIAAAQLLYGANMTTRTGDTVYGFNSNAGHAVFSIASATQAAVFCIWDAGGNDTLDLSGYSTNSEIDLREMSFSSAGPATTGNAIYNISIARGAVIENAIGGASSDTIIGNDVSNALTGGGGNDALFGGLGIDTANFSVASTGASWHRNTDGTWTVTAGADGTDTTNSVEFLHFTDRDVHLDTAERTYSGDGTSDILFRNTGGAVVAWNVFGTTFGSSSYLATVAPAQWTSLGSGDLNGDGGDEILWRNVSNGGVYSWQTDGAGTITAVGAIANLGPEWSFLGSGDFNGDGKDDLAWRNTNGAVYSWDMNGSAISSSGPLASLGAEWSLKGIGDFNGDGKDDFLWRNSSGGSYIWSMNDRAISVAATSAQAGNDWHIMGVGDFNGDGRDDILWQNDNGQVAEWTMNGATLSSSGFIAVVGPEWHVMGIGDYNGDGKDDILWQNDNGAVYAWMLNGSSILQAGAIASVGPEWGII